MFKKKKSKKKEQDYTPSKGQTHFFDPASLEEDALPDLRAIALKFHHEVNRLEEVADGTPPSPSHPPRAPREAGRNARTLKENGPGVRSGGPLQAAL